MSLLNNFDASDPAFSVFSMTEAINVIPNMYGRLNELNLFPTKGLATRTFFMESYEGVLVMLPTKAPGAPGTVGKSGKRKGRTFSIPHIPHDDAIKPEDLQGVRQFNTANSTKTLASVVAEKLADMRNKHDITLEWMRVNALQGVVKDAESTTLVDLFTEFGITQKVVNFALTTSSTNVRNKCAEVIRHMEDNLLGETMSGVRALVSPEFMDSLISHPSVIDAYKYASSNSMMREDIRKSFTFAGITFEEYRGKATDPAGSTQNFITTNEARFYPVGTRNVFNTFYAPADFFETVNTIGLPMYAKQELMKFNRGLEIHTQSNPLPFCSRPALLVKGTKS